MRLYRIGYTRTGTTSKPFTNNLTYFMLRELEADGYIVDDKNFDNGYIIDVDYNGTFAGYNQLFSDILPKIKVEIREELINELLND